MNKTGISLIIGDIIDLQDGNLVIAVNFPSLEVRMEYRELDFETVKNHFKGKKLRIVCDDFEFNTVVLEVEVSSSLANFKNIFLKVKKTSKSVRIKELDEIYVDL